ncbi:RICIN domain-containing protein [Kutzneria sp. NPDC051319]|uniref:RICIN domain-containing protein n=1 Tax=Kutzneria sp. NPDC051319 TaxID=3155047 RepID=UPI003428E987
MINGADRLQHKQVTAQRWTSGPATTGRALEVAGGSHAKGADLVQRTHNGGNNKLWYFEPAGRAYVIRDFETEPRPCVDVVRHKVGALLGSTSARSVLR